LHTFYRYLALVSAFLLIGGILAPTPLTSNLGATRAQVAQAEIADPEQAQPPNETLLLGINSTAVHVGDTIIFEGVLTPPFVAGILLTITWPDGSWENFRLQSNETGEFSYELYMPMDGQFRASALLVNTTAVMSNAVTFVVTYTPKTEPGNETTSSTSTVPASSTAPATSTTPSSGSNTSSATQAPVSTRNTTNWLSIGVAISLVVVLLVVSLAYVERREGRRKANIPHKPDGV